MSRIGITLGVVVVSLGALGYLPPVDEKNGVRVEIESFPQKIERPAGNIYRWPLGVTRVKAAATGATVRTFPVTLANSPEKEVSGRLDVWLNDDWGVTGPTGDVVLAAGAHTTLVFTATAKSAALDALYPVHARFTPSGGSDESAVHAIAVFRFDHPKAPRTARPAAEKRRSAWPKSPSDCAAGALVAARRALKEGTDESAHQWRLVAPDATYGAGVAYGPHGLVDGALAFTDGMRDVVFRGFTANVMAPKGGQLTEPCAEIREEKGTLRIRWTLGVKPDRQGLPRFADLAVGPASVRPLRLYAGTGNVILDPKRFEIKVGGPSLTTRHIGVDYTNGLSVVQAVDVMPDKVVCDGARNVCSLCAHHDVTFTFVPSAQGSFAAARRFRAVAGYRKSPGHDAFGSRMCLDQWGGEDFRAAAAGIAQAAKYGVRDAIYITHDWQRWGRDYRLPEIYPPAKDPEGFGLLRAACRTAGILFGPHDNYTDIYPDTAGYSYDLVVFNLDGTPQRAWYNARRHAQSYRWAPHAFHPWALGNAKLLKRGYDPEAIFIDVFTALDPFDYIDRTGRFHSKVEVTASWAKGFAAYREGYGNPHAICMSEGAMDHLVGVVDAGECDHFPASRWAKPGKAFSDAERTPWHDIVTHGYYVLLAGGLGFRYSAPNWETSGDNEQHGYGSDDYLSTCIAGGRNPMCDGPFSRNAVKTYWLQHDACAELGRAEFLDLRYEQGDIHRQHAVFSEGGEVWVNRGKTPWRLPDLGVTLPRYGYFAKTRTTESGVVAKDGVRYAFAKSPMALFVDARPPTTRMAAQSERRQRELGVNMTRRPVSFGGIETDGAFRFVGGDTLVPMPESLPFAAKIDLSAVGAKGRILARVEMVEPERDAKPPHWTQTGDVVTIDADAKSFAYRLEF